MNELEPIAPEIATLFEAERRFEGEPDARKARVLLRLGGSVAAIGLAAGVAHGVHATLGLTLLARVAAFARTKLAIFLGALAVGGTVGYGVADRRADSHPVSIPASVALAPGPVVVPSTLPAAVVPSSAPSVTAASTVAPSSRAPLTSAPRPVLSALPREDLAGELALVQMARTAVARRDYDGAITATNQHIREFPQGQLAEERESVAIQALIGAGREAEARTRASRFRGKYPRSSFLPAIDAAVRSIP